MPSRLLSWAALLVFAVPLGAQVPKQPLPGTVTPKPPVVHPQVELAVVHATPTTVPPSIGRTSWMRALDLSPSQLANGRAVRFSPSTLHARDGQLTLLSADLIPGRSGQYVAYMSFRSLTGTMTTDVGTVTATFATRRGGRYLVDFVLQPDTAQGEYFQVPSELRSRPIFTIESCSGDAQQVNARDGHVALLIPAAPELRCRVTLSSGAPYIAPGRYGVIGYPWTFFYVEITPLP